MTVEPTIGPIESDPQRDAVYFAEGAAREIVETDGEALAPDDVEAFARNALDTAGWDSDPAPTIVLDVADDAQWAAWHEAETRIIHLHPRLLSPWVVLHELAHWVDPRGGHGPRFCANYAELVAAVLGDDAAVELLAAFRDLEVEVDQTWLSETLRQQ